MAVCIGRVSGLCNDKAKASIRGLRADVTLWETYSGGDERRVLYLSYSLPDRSLVKQFSGRNLTHAIDNFDQAAAYIDQAAG